MNYKIPADSTCDLSPELLEQYGLGLTPLYVQLGEKTYRDGVDIFPDDIYAHVANGGFCAGLLPSGVIGATFRMYSSNWTNRPSTNQQSYKIEGWL